VLALELAPLTCGQSSGSAVIEFDFIPVVSELGSSVNNPTGEFGPDNLYLVTRC